MFCFCAKKYALEILMQETPTNTWAETVIKAHIYVTFWRVGGAFITFLPMSLWVFFALIFPFQPHSSIAICTKAKRLIILLFLNNKRIILPIKLERENVENFGKMR